MALAGVLVWAASLATAPGGALPTVSTQFGELVGAWLGGGVTQYMGIPYALPPVDERRFADPAPWTAAFPGRRREALAAGAQCPQPSGGATTSAGARAGSTALNAGSSEDCLFLNVWRPDAPQKPQSVSICI